MDHDNDEHDNDDVDMDAQNNDEDAVMEPADIDNDDDAANAQNNAQAPELPPEVQHLYDTLRARGYDRSHARTIVYAQLCMILMRKEMARFDQHANDPLKITISANLEPNMPPLQHDDVLLPYWKRFIGALSSVADSERGRIRLCFHSLQLGNEGIQKMLLQTFEMAHRLKILVLSQIGEDGIRFATSALSRCSSLEAMKIESIIVSENDVTALVDSLVKHPRLDEIGLVECGLGRNDSALFSAFVPVLKSFSIVNLSGNEIGSRGGRLIAECLAENPLLGTLRLEDNLLEDEDALNLSVALLVSLSDFEVRLSRLLP